MVRKSEKEAALDQETAAEIALAKIIGELDSLLDIPLTLSAELGRTQMTVKEIMQLQVGSVLELSKLVGEPMEIHINDLLTARGETVVVNERFGIRVTDVIDPLEIVRTSV
ncbi:Flagellar motor switch protein FliN [hydrothermal vent metagenome]|uniref:Flagellar motor switch protein FliN n=1 Tax=hydrothermal vent metagenome TaxID=652676 RepID=A0A3B1CSM8_9ZZZZ